LSMFIDAIVYCPIVENFALKLVGVGEMNDA
jgi:hypothetical protein